MDCIVHGVTKSQKQPSDFHFTNLNLPSGHLEMILLFYFVEKNEAT